MFNNKKAMALILCALIVTPSALATGSKNVPPKAEDELIQRSWTEAFSDYISDLWLF